MAASARTRSAGRGNGTSGQPDQQILDALQRLMDSVPLGSFDVDRIAVEAGITSAQFLRHFDSKEAALAELLRRRQNTDAPPPKQSLDSLILDALERLLASVPMGEIDVDQIAAEAGVTRAQFLSVFTSEDDALSTLLATRKLGATPKPKARRDEMILDALERLLATTPMSEIDVEQIAAEAGITRTRFYHYYKSKQDALAALLNRLGGVLRRVYTRPDSWFVDRPADMRPRESLLATMNMFTTEWWPHRFVLREVADIWGSAPAIRDSYLDGLDFAVDCLRRAIDRERESGAAPPGPPSADLAQSLLWCSERNAFRSYSELPGAFSWEELVEAMTNVWMRAIYLHDDPDPPGAPVRKRRAGS